MGNSSAPGSRRNAYCGVSLVELLVVLLITAVLAVIRYSIVQPLQQQQLLRAGQQALYRWQTAIAEQALENTELSAMAALASRFETASMRLHATQQSQQVWLIVEFNAPVGTGCEQLSLSMLGQQMPPHCWSR